MNQSELITALVGSATLDLSVTIKDTNESTVTAKFLALTFENNSQVTMKLQITTNYKDIIVNTQGESEALAPVVTTKMIRADYRTQIPVIDENGDPILDDDANPLTVPEDVFWKYLAWERPLFTGFRPLIENVIKVKFSLAKNTTVLQITRADYGL